MVAVFDRFKRLFSEDESYYDDEVANEEVVENANVHVNDQVSATAPVRPTTMKALPSNNLHKRTNGNGQSNSKIGILEPKIFNDSKLIGQSIINGEAVIVNFSKIDEDVAKRILDFVSGTVFAVNGSIERIGEKIFIVTPENFEISNAPVDAIENSLRY